jgi:hypothetical protein
MTRPQLLRYAAIGAGAVVVLAVAVLAFQALRTPFQPATSAPSSGPCSPQPCANMRGYILWVTDLKIDSGVVMLHVKFQNSSNSTHAEPDDMSLIDRTNQTFPPVFDPPGCTHWARTDFNNGKTLGPEPMCFRPSTAEPPLSLQWTPDEGFFCCETRIPLNDYQNAPSPSNT